MEIVHIKQSKLELSMSVRIKAEYEALHQLEHT